MSEFVPGAWERLLGEIGGIGYLFLVEVLISEGLGPKRASERVAAGDVTNNHIRRLFMYLKWRRLTENRREARRWNQRRVAMSHSAVGLSESERRDAESVASEQLKDYINRKFVSEAPDAGDEAIGARSLNYEELVSAAHDYARKIAPRGTDVKKLALALMAIGRDLINGVPVNEVWRGKMERAFFYRYVYHAEKGRRSRSRQAP